MSTRQSLLVMMVVLLLSTLACSLAIGEDQNSENGEPTKESEGVPLAEAGSTPLAPLPDGQAVAVISHTDGQQVYNNQNVDLTVQSSSTTTQFVLKVNGSTVGIKPMPPDQSGATQAILSWKPSRNGTYSIQVLAYNGSTLNGSTSLNLVVAGNAPAEGQQPSGTCTGTVLVLELNFRDGPGTAAKRLGQFNISESVIVIGRNNDTSWYKVRRADGQEWWAVNNGNWFRVEGACSALSVVQ